MSNTVIYKKSTNNFGGWSYAARPEAEDSKFYKFEGEWLYVIKDRAELISLRDQGTWMTSTGPNQLYVITDKDGITKSIPMNNLITTRVNDMNYIFYNTPFNQPIENWDVSNVVGMAGMFWGSSFNQDIGNWDTGKVENMNSAFRDSVFNKPIGNWDVRNVVSMRYMFAYGSSFNKPIGNWDVRNVTDMRGMFRDSSFNQDISSWDVKSVRGRAWFDKNTPSWVLPKPNFKKK